MKAVLLASAMLSMATLSLAPPMHAQAARPVGTVALSDASVTSAGATLAPASSGRATLSGTSIVTAKAGRNAEVTLARGGSVVVCQTSALHLSSAADASLLLALDRGAVEIHMKAASGDVLMTPDLRFVMTAGGALDLRLHVTFNGDTCVENRGRKAPLLDITDAFGENAYQLKPGQHVLFEHGSLREVVDRETTPCGCPPDQPGGVSIADAILNSGQARVTPQQTAAAYPFPVAASEGLAPATPLPADAPGATHVQVATALIYDPTAAPPTPAPTPPATPTASPEDIRNAVAAMSVDPAPTGPKHGPIAAIGRFFKHIFVR